MLGEKIKLFKETENGHPVFYTRPLKEALFREDHRVIEVDILHSLDGIKHDIILDCNQANYYHFFEKNSGLGRLAEGSKALC